MKKIVLALLLLPCIAYAADSVQSKAIVVNRALVDKILKISADTSNAHDIEVMLGAPSACVPVNAAHSEVWMCQWKGDLASNRIDNTLNVTFESGMIAKVVGVDAKGKYIVG